MKKRKRFEFWLAKHDFRAPLPIFSFFTSRYVTTTKFSWDITVIAERLMMCSLDKNGNFFGMDNFSAAAWYRISLGLMPGCCSQPVWEESVALKCEKFYQSSVLPTTWLFGPPPSSKARSSTSLLLHTHHPTKLATSSANNNLGKRNNSSQSLKYYLLVKSSNIPPPFSLLQQ